MQVTEVTKLRRRVLTEVARQAFNGTLIDEISSIPKTVVTEDGLRYRCCIHKERAILRNRVSIALCQDVGDLIEDAAIAATNNEFKADQPIISVLPEACDGCPIDRFVVTDACRNCLAHNCMLVCPKKAITIHQKKAYIDQSRCVECGLCKKSCPYAAIIELSRPCERVCGVQAISADSTRKAVIDRDKCVECGACKIACPFGAIADLSFVVPVINEINAGKELYAMVAPAFVGQFGPKITPGQLFTALKQLGFTDVYEVGLGADMVTIAEAEEFLATVPEKQSYMTTSCCPGFVGLIEKHLSPEVAEHMSTTISPMVATAKVVKKEHPNSITVFIGPCTAKKTEAKKYPGIVDYVLTYEEIATMFVGKNINVTMIEDDGYQMRSSKHGAIFARAGGVLQSVAETIAAEGKSDLIKPANCDGLEDCKTMLLQIQKGKLDVNMMEGMACAGGCVNGAGILADSRLSSKLVENASKTNTITQAIDNSFAKEQLKDIDMHIPH